MTRKVSTCTEADTVAVIMERMTEGKFRHLPVVEQGKLVGVISIGDVVKSARRGDRGREQRAARVHRDGVVNSRHARAQAQHAVDTTADGDRQCA